MKEYSVVGKRIPRIDGANKASGEVKFSGDILLPRMLYGKILRSPYPHAKIVQIETVRAKRLPGVKAVITGKDTADMKYGSLSFDLFVDEHPLALDKVRYVGDEVAAVAAIDEDTAEEALDLIEVEFEPLPAVFDPEEAIKPDAPRIHESIEGNLCAMTTLVYGDVEKGFLESDYIREDKFECLMVAHCQMETNSVVASVDSSGKLTVWPSCMCPYARRSWLAYALKMDESKIRVINPYVGGAFGGKEDMCSLDVCAALLSIKTQRPVKIVYTREEQFTSSRTDRGTVSYLKTGVKRDGTLVSHEFKLIASQGAYAGIAPVFIYLQVPWLVGTYRMPNVKYEGKAAYTNLPTGGPKRSHGNPQTRFALESQLDMIAEDLGIDPLEIRLKNAVKTGEILPTQAKIISCGLTECIERSAERMGWKEKRGKLPKNRGIGMGCCTLFGGGTSPPRPFIPGSSAFVKCNEDGTVHILTSTVDPGSGLGTMYAQIAAEELGLHIEDIRLSLGDTDFTPPSLSIHLSGSTFVTGKAVRLAAADVKDQIFKVVAEKLENSVEDLEAKDRRVYVKGSPEKGMSFVEAVRVSYRELGMGGNPLLGKGYYSPQTWMDLSTGVGQFTPTYVFANAVAEVEVDTETGKVKVCELAIAHDCGFAINPMEVEGQLDGSFSMGSGQALSEEMVFENGKLLNPSFLDYRLPISLDVPKRTLIIVESLDPEGPFGAKEVGEGSTATAVPAIANAIYDAIGVRIKELPITPEKILKALEEKNKSPKG